MGSIKSDVEILKHIDSVITENGGETLGIQNTSGYAHLVLKIEFMTHHDVDGRIGGKSYYVEMYVDNTKLSIGHFGITDSYEIDLANPNSMTFEFLNNSIKEFIKKWARDEIEMHNGDIQRLERRIRELEENQLGAFS